MSLLLNLQLDRLRRRGSPHQSGFAGFACFTESSSINTATPVSGAGMVTTRSVHIPDLRPKPVLGIYGSGQLICDPFIHWRIQRSDRWREAIIFIVSVEIYQKLDRSKPKAMEESI